MVAYNKDIHMLLRDRAHKSRIHTDTELSEYFGRVRDAGVEIIDVNVPDWPPASKSRLQIGGGNPFEGQFWTGVQPAIVMKSDSGVESYRHGDFVLYKNARYVSSAIAREMGGDLMQSHRLSYQWQVPVYDSAQHVLIRKYLADNDKDIVDFLNVFYPRLMTRLGRDPITEVANPDARVDKDRWGQWSPTRRVFATADLMYLEEFVGDNPSFEYNLTQQVMWQRALDDSRWEARRQVEPQSSEWMSHKSYIMRPIGDGAWTEADRDPVHRHAFGPYMELHDDGRLNVWVGVRARSVLENTPMVINGVSINLEIDIESPTTLVMAAQLSAEDREAVLQNKVETRKESAVREEEEDVRTSIITVPRFTRNGKFYRVPDDVELPSMFNRTGNKPRIVLKRSGNGSEIRVFGGDALTKCIHVLNGYDFSVSQPFRDGYKTRVTEDVIDGILAAAKTKPKPKPQIFHIEDVPVPVPVVEPEPIIRPPSVTDGAVAYPAGEVIKVLRDELGSGMRVFGRMASDSVVLAMSREGVELFLREDLTDKREYVSDTGGLSYDCENFAESIRVHLNETYGLNSIGIVWGDKHAWNFITIDGDE